MRLWTRADVAQLIEGRTVALVGSGPGVCHNPEGLIDNHDVVVRINNYKLMPGTGRRTDVFYSFFGQSIRKTREELQRDRVKLCYCKCPDARVMESDWHVRNRKENGVDFRYIFRARSGWWFGPVYVPMVAEFLAHFELLGGHIPTTGFSALLDVLSYHPKMVFMTGFDFFQSGVHNVTERWRPGRADDPIGHDPRAERAWFIANVEKLPVRYDLAMKKALRGEWQAPQTRRQQRYTRVRLREVMT